MKNLKCRSSYDPFEASRLVYDKAPSGADKYGKGMETGLAFEHGQIDAHELLDYDQAKKQVEPKLDAFVVSTLSTLSSENGEKTKEEKAALDAIDQKTPKGKKEHAKKKAEFEAAKAARDSAYAKMGEELQAAKQATLEKLQGKITEKIEERKAQAKEFSDSWRRKLLEHGIAERKGDSYKILTGSSNFKAISDIGFGEYTLAVAPKEGPGSKEWDEEQMQAATVALLEVVYIEDGPEAAAAKAAEIVANSKSFGKPVDYDVLHASFGGSTDGMGPRGSIQYSLDENICPPLESSYTTGRIWGLMYQADKVFSKEASSPHFQSYRAYVEGESQRIRHLPGEQALEEVKRIMTPKEWAMKHSPEVFTEEKRTNPDQFAANVASDVIDRIPVPSDEKERPAYDQKVAQVQEIIRGVIEAEPDSAKWEKAVEAALAQMMGGKFEASKLGTVDPEKVLSGRGLYGSIPKRLDPRTKAYISGLIFGAERAYENSKYSVEEGGKVVERDFLTRYKAAVNAALGKGKSKEGAESGFIQVGVAEHVIDQAYDDMRDQKAESRDNNPKGKLTKEEKARIEATYNARVYDIIRKNLPKPKQEFEKADKVTQKLTDEKMGTGTGIRAEAEEAEDKKDKKKGKASKGRPTHVAGGRKSPAAKPKASTRRSAAPRRTASRPASEPEVVVSSPDAPGSAPSVEEEAVLRSAAERKAFASGMRRALRSKKRGSLTGKVEGELSDFSGIGEGQDVTVNDRNTGITIRVARNKGKLEAQVEGATAKARRKYRLPSSTPDYSGPAPETRVAGSAPNPFSSNKERHAKANADIDARGRARRKKRRG
ncbi:hypothetical protein ACFL2V_04505 [Pseudomonadota bacterium]